MKNSLIVLSSVLLFLGCLSISTSKKVSLDQILKTEDNWQKVEEGQTSIYYIQNSKTGENISEISQKTVVGMNKAKAYLGETYSKPVNIVTVDDFDAIQKIVGRKTSGVAYHKKDLLVEIAGVSTTCHEKFHILSLNQWGESKTWLIEGTAVACDREWWGYPLHNLAHYLLKKNKLVPLEKLAKNSKSFKKENDLFTYPQSGSLVQFMEEKYGRSSLKQLWESGDFQQSLGKSREAFEEEWKQAIQQYPIAEIDYFGKINYDGN